MVRHFWLYLFIILCADQRRRIKLYPKTQTQRDLYFVFLNKKIEKMLTKWLAAFLTSTMFVFVVCFMYGFIALIFPLMLVFWFFLFLGLFIFRTMMEASSTPGVEKLEEPDFWLSPVYFAWQYYNDRKRWAKHITILSYAIGLIFGSMFGVATVILSKLDYPPPASWLTGVLWMTIIAILIARSKCMTEQI